MSEIKKKGALKDKNKKISTYKWWAFCHLATIFIKYTNHLGQSLLSKLGKSARPSLCLSLCCVFPLNSWDGSCQSAPICRTIHSVSFKNLWIFFFLVTIVWRRPKHQYPRQQQSNSSVSLTSISKPMPKENLSTQLRLNSFFQPFLNLFISISTCSLLNSIKLFMMSLPDCWNICGPEPWVQCLDWWGDLVLLHFSEYCDIMIGEKICKEDGWFHPSVIVMHASPTYVHKVSHIPQFTCQSFVHKLHIFPE